MRNKSHWWEFKLFRFKWNWNRSVTDIKIYSDNAMALQIRLKIDMTKRSVKTSSSSSSSSSRCSAIRAICLWQVNVMDWIKEEPSQHRVWISDPEQLIDTRKSMKLSKKTMTDILYPRSSLHRRIIAGSLEVCKTCTLREYAGIIVNRSPMALTLHELDNKYSKDSPGNMKQ